MVHEGFRSHSWCYLVLLFFVYDEKNRATTQTSLDCFYKKVDRIEPSKEQELVTSKTRCEWNCSFPHLLLLESFSYTVFYPLSLPQAVTLLSSTLKGSPCVSGIAFYCCIFQVLCWMIKRCFLFCICFSCIICVKNITDILKYSTMELIVLVKYLTNFLGPMSTLDLWTCS